MNKAVSDATDRAINLAHLAREANEAKALVEDALADGKRKVQRLAKRGYRLAEDSVEDTTYLIRRHPWESVIIAAGLGAGVGILTFLLVSRQYRQL